MRFAMICKIASGLRHRAEQPWLSGIGQRLRKPNPLWTNGQVEQVNRRIKDATVKPLHSDIQDRLRAYLTDFMATENFAHRLKRVGALTPYEYVCKFWSSEPDSFILNPIHPMPGLHSQMQ